MKKMLKKIESFYRYLSPMRVVLVSCGDIERANIITIAWCSAISASPPILGIAVHPKRHSHKIIKKKREFVVNAPTFGLLKETHYCGSVSGKDVDKIESTGMTMIPSVKVKSPSIKECAVNCECRVIEGRRYGDHTWFVGEVVNVRYDTEVFKDGKMKDEFSPILYLGGNVYSNKWGKIVEMKR